jgi:hypothetical protein
MRTRMHTHTYTHTRKPTNARTRTLISRAGGECASPSKKLSPSHPAKLVATIHNLQVSQLHDRPPPRGRPAQVVSEWSHTALEVEGLQLVAAVQQCNHTCSRNRINHNR